MDKYASIILDTYLRVIPERMYGFGRYIYINFGIYLLWIITHYIASHLYIHWCVPATIMGLIMSPFMAASPHCYGLRWIITTGGTSIVVMWSLVGTWMLTKIIPIKNE
jgi:hypothetical protein